jgi:BirA family biotin operon repressor/biotin-[acetyl-CoA-carboxylase] ligase
MDARQVETALKNLPLGGMRCFEQIGSTNDEAMRWVAQGAPHLALLLAEEQTAGRGRTGTTWYSPAGASLAFSLILYPHHLEPYILPRLTALGALAVKDALNKLYDLPAQIKWPNDVLVHRQKVCGVLCEAQWDGDEVKALVLGIGVNVTPESISQVQNDSEAIQASCLEMLLGRPVDRLALLQAVLAEVIAWLPRLSTQEFLQAWESSLAFRGEWVRVSMGQSRANPGLPGALESYSPTMEEGKVIGLSQDGSLRLRTAFGEIVKVNVGEMHLRPS